MADAMIGRITGGAITGFDAHGAPVGTNTDSASASAEAVRGGAGSVDADAGEAGRSGQGRGVRRQPGRHRAAGGDGRPNPAVPGDLKQFLLIRDRHCRAPYCPAPGRHADHPNHLARTQHEKLILEYTPTRSGAG